MKFSRLIASILCTFLFGTVVFAQNDTRRFQPVISIGTGLFVQNPLASENGLSTSVSAGLDVRLSEAWSVMPRVASRNVSQWDAFASKEGGDPDMYGLVDFSLSLRYHSIDNWVIGLGPYYCRAINRDAYYIDADPWDILNDKPKIKKNGFGIQPSVENNVGKHWTFGLMADICHTDMRQYYEWQTGTYASKHVSSFEFFVGFRF